MNLVDLTLLVPWLGFAVNGSSLIVLRRLLFLEKSASVVCNGK